MKRAIFYLLYHPQGALPDYVLYALERLRPHAETLRVIVNGSLEMSDIERLEHIVDTLQLRPNSGLDVGGYQDAIREVGFEELATFDELILMNHTWYGPIGSFKPLFERMDERELDFWGMTDHDAVTPNPITGKGSMRAHLQSHWIAVRQRVLSSEDWRSYWEKMPTIASYTQSILQHESRFTGHFADLGYRWEAAFPKEHYGVDHPAFVCAEQLLLDGCPVLKRRPFFHDPLYLDAEAIIGRELIDTAAAKGYPTELIWADLVPTTQPRVLNTNASQLEVVSDSPANQVEYDGFIAAVLHVFYEDMTDELLDRVAMLPGTVDLFISTTDEAKAQVIRDVIEARNLPLRHSEVRVLESNRGRDLSSYFIAMRDVVRNTNYDLIVKLHSKKTVQRGATAGEFFKRQQIENLVHSAGYVRNLFGLFEADKQLGLVFPPTIHTGYPTLGGAWFANKEPAQAYAERLGITVPLDEVSPLGALGAMWICRPEALQLMTDVEYSYEDYQSEAEHGDGSLAHVQERMVAYAAAQRGFKTKTVANAHYIAISHTYLEYKLDQALAVLPGFALHSIPLVRHHVQTTQDASTLGRRGLIKTYLSTHHPQSGAFLRRLYLPIRKLRRKLAGLD